MIQFPVWLFFSKGFSKNISTSVGFLFPSDILRRILLWEQWQKISRIRIKVGLCGHLTLPVPQMQNFSEFRQLIITCDRTVGITSMNSNVNEYLTIHLSTKMNEKVMTTFKKKINKVHCMHVVQKKEMKVDRYPY